MSQVIRNLEKEQNKIMFFHLCREFDQTSYNKLSATDKNYINKKLEAFTKEEVIELIAIEIEDTISKQYISASKEQFFIPWLLVQKYGLKVTDEVKISYPQDFLSYWGLNFDHKFYPYTAKESLAFATVLFDEQLDVTKYILSYITSSHSDSQIEKVLSLLKDEYKNEVYYNKIIKHMTPLHLQRILDYYINNYREYFSDFQELLEHPISKSYLSQPEQQISTFVKLVKLKFIEDEMMMGYYHRTSDYENRLLFIENFLFKNLKKIIQLDPSAIHQIGLFHLNNLIFIGKKVSQPIYDIAHRAAYNFYSQLLQHSPTLFDELKEQMFKSLNTRIENSSTPSEISLYEKTLLQLNSLDSRDTNSTHTLKI